MSAPPLPEVFGNYALVDFAEVVSPASISWLPQTAGWLWLGLLAGALLARLGWRRLHHWWRNRYRREALKALERLPQADAAIEVAELNRLLKLTALAAWPRPLVAPLSGEAWVDFLNSRCDLPPFDRDLGRLLARGPYLTGTAETSGAGSLAEACRLWIVRHRGPWDA